MLKQPIAVLGGGNAGHAMAADLTLAGYKVSFYEHRSFDASFSTTLESGVVELSGVGRQGTAQIHKITLDMEEAIADAKLINLCVPAIGHEVFLAELTPHLQDGQVVVLWSAQFGSLRLYELLKDRHPQKKVTIYETNTMAYGTRLAGPAKAWCMTMPRLVTTSALPASDTPVALSQLREVFPMLAPAQNVLAVGLSNVNPIVHPAALLLNVGRIQYSKGDFYMYREGITDAVAHVIHVVYDEAAAVGEALGVEVLGYEERDFNNPTSIVGAIFQAPFDTQGTIGSVIGPTSIKSRYITEDLAYGLVPMSQLGKKLGVSTPITDGIVNLGSVICQQDFWKTGRTLESLGLAKLSKEEILNLVER